MDEGVAAALLGCVNATQVTLKRALSFCHPPETRAKVLSVAQGDNLNSKSPARVAE